MGNAKAPDTGIARKTQADGVVKEVLRIFANFFAIKYENRFSTIMVTPKAVISGYSGSGIILYSNFITIELARIKVIMVDIINNTWHSIIKGIFFIFLIKHMHPHTLHNRNINTMIGSVEVMPIIFIYIPNFFRSARICRLTSLGAGPPGRARALTQAAGLSAL